MQITGIICEYNPLHTGHKKQIDFLKSQGHCVVCLMSGNFVQRGHPAIFDKMTRAQAAIACGADLVLELPLPFALSSAEGFAQGGVQILSKICDNICFGAETADADRLLDTANALLSPAFSEKLRHHLDRGLSFPAARAAALADCGHNSEILATPNNILAIEYCKAILMQNAQLKPIVIHRGGSYHDTQADLDNPSATSLRQMIITHAPWQCYVPKAAAVFFEKASVHTLQLGEKAMLAKLRTMHDTEFEALPFGSEGLWRKLMRASRSCSDLQSIIDETKSKRYTRTRIDRMILCAYLGLTESLRTSTVPYCRVLAFNDAGRDLLRSVKDSGYFVNIGQRTNSDYEALEYRSTALYGLFANQPEAPEMESKYRLIYHKTPAHD